MFFFSELAHTASKRARPMSRRRFVLEYVLRDAAQLLMTRCRARGSIRNGIWSATNDDLRVGPDHRGDRAAVNGAALDVVEKLDVVAAGVDGSVWIWSRPPGLVPGRTDSSSARTVPQA
jgi:hypothetical protein